LRKNSQVKLLQFRFISEIVSNQGGCNSNLKSQIDILGEIEELT